MADDDIYGSGGYDIDEYGNMVPRGTTLNSNPTMTATPGSPGGPEISTPQGGQVSTRVINTPDSSRGTPFRYSPSALSPTPRQVGAPNTITPSSRSGAPPPAIRNAPTAQELMPSSSQPIPGWAGALGTGGLWGLGGYLMGQTIEPQPTNQGEDAVLKRFQPAPNTTIGTQTGVQPVTQTQPLGQTSPITGPPPPPTMTLPPGYPPLPPPRPMAAVPPLPIGARAPVQHAGSPNLGYGVPGVQPSAPQAPSPMFTTIDRPNADVSGGRSVAGQLAPQYFNRAREPGGPAQMGALDLSGLFNHPAVAQAAAAHPMVQAAARAPVQGPLSALAPQRAPVVQQQWSLPQVRKGGAAMIRPTWGNPATGGATVGGN